MSSESFSIMPRVTIVVLKISYRLLRHWSNHIPMHWSYHYLVLNHRCISNHFRAGCWICWSSIRCLGRNAAARGGLIRQILKPCTCRIFHKMHKNMYIMYIIHPHCYDTGSWNPSSCKRRNYHGDARGPHNRNFIITCVRGIFTRNSSGYPWRRDV